MINPLSIVIPVGPNDSSWRQLLKDLVELDSEFEIVLAACEDLPVSFKLPANVTWLCGAQGRAKQLNAGARKAHCEGLWFLHADSRLSIDNINAVNRFMTDQVEGLGYFRLKFTDGPVQTRLNAWAANIRADFFKLPFGDQGFIIPKTIFEQMQGFDEKVKPGEDLDFIIRLRSAGIPIVPLAASLETSARRYQQQGWLLTTVNHVYLTWSLARQARRRLAID